MTKRTPPKTSNDRSAPRGRVVTIGSGMTERTSTVFDLNNPKDVPKVLEHLIGRGSVVGEGSGEAASSVGYEREVARARRTLEGANLPTDPGKTYPSPDNRGKCTLLHLVEKSGYKQDDAKEWYAAKILQCWHEATGAGAELERDRGTLTPGSFRSLKDRLQRYMGELGETVATARMKFRWDPTVKIGKRHRETQSIKGTRSGAKKKTAAEKKWEPIREAARKIADDRKEKDLRHGKSLIASMLKKRRKLGDSISTIRQNI